MTAQPTSARRCSYCGTGTMQPNQTTTLTLERPPTTMVLRGVPAQVCDACGEASVDEATTQHVLEVFEEAVRNRVESEIRAYVPPAATTA